MRVESRERPANSFILDNRKGNLIEVTFFDDIKSFLSILKYFATISCI